MYPVVQSEIDAELGAAQRTATWLEECHVLLIRIGYGSGMPGDRPLAGGVQVEARRLLEAHGVITREGESDAHGQ